MPCDPCRFTTRMVSMSSSATSHVDVLDTSTPCGELACQKDFLLQTLTTVVVSCTERKTATATSPDKRVKKSKKKPPKAAEGSGPTVAFDVTLRDTILFPAGGGQSCDHGTVGGVPCTDVRNEGGVALHALPQPLEIGSTVDVVLDCERRADHAAQHTAQHLISGLARKMLGADTARWNLSETPDPCFVDLEVDPSNLTEERMSMLEAACNEEIRSCTEVRPEWVSRDELRAKFDGGLMRGSSEAVPEGVDRVRVVSIGVRGAVDANACCGTHVPTLSLLGSIKLLSIESVKGTSRVAYLAGDRLLAYLGRTAARERSLVATLSVSPEMIAERVDNVLENLKRAERKANALLAEVVEMTVARLRLEASTGRSGLTFAAVHREGEVDSVYLKLMTSAMDRISKEEDGALPSLVLITIGEADVGSFLLSGDPESVTELGPLLANILQGRGGGRSGKYQGKCELLTKRDEAEAAIRDRLSSKV